LDEEIEEIVEANRKHETKAKQRVADMYPDTRRLLTNFYTKYTHELADMLHDPTFRWW
jgi:hypothetical protein